MPESAAVELRPFALTARGRAKAIQRIREDACGSRLSRVFRLYYRLRPLIPVSVRRRLQRRRKIEATDHWYLPDALAESVAEGLPTESTAPRIVHPWPGGARYGLVLTHDVETEAGFRNVLRLADVEEELGFRSSWNVVPYKYKIDERILGELRSRSFEIGIHGYKHDGRLFWSRREFERRAPAINRALARYGAVGFRAPMVHRNLEWLQGLDVKYDASCFDVDSFQPIPGGVGTIWPFMAGKFVELPYTLPQDHTLLVALGRRDGRIWETKRDFLIRHHGMVLMLTHPDYLTSDEQLDLYRRFLTTTRDIGGYWHALPREVAAWWRAREESTPVKDALGRWSIEGPARSRGAVASVEFRHGELSLESVEGADASVPSPGSSAVAARGT